MARISDLRAALAAALPDDVQPLAQVATGPLPRDPQAAQTMGGGLCRQFVICVKTGAAGDPAAQEMLDDVLEPAGPLSVQAALDADVSLGGVAQFLSVVASTGWRHYPGDPVQVGAEITVEITA